MEFLGTAVALEELCGGVRPGVGKGSVGSAATWLGNKRPSRAAARAQGSAGDHLPGEERQFLPCPSFFTLCEKLFVAGGEPLLPTSLLLPKKAAPQLPGLHPRRNHTATVHAWPPACLCPGGSCQWLLPCNSHPGICSGRCPEAMGQPSSWKNRAGTPAQMSCSCPMTLMK